MVVCVECPAYSLGVSADEASRDCVVLADRARPQGYPGRWRPNRPTPRVAPLSGAGPGWRGRGWRRRRRRWGCSALASGLWRHRGVQRRVLGNGLSNDGWLRWLGLGLAPFGFAFAAYIFLWTPRAVEVDAAAVRLRAPARTISIPWADLEAVDEARGGLGRPWCGPVVEVVASTRR